MELRALRYFVAVAQAGSVTAGSAASHVSQPAVSRQLRALERELGVALFVRSEGGVRLTAAGTELLVLVRDLLAREAGLKRVAASLAAGRLQSLTIAAPSTTLSDVIAPFLAGRSMRARVETGVGLHDHDDPETALAVTPRINVITRRSDEVFVALDDGADLAVAPAVPPPHQASMLIAQLPVRAYVGARGLLDDADERAPGSADPGHVAGGRDASRAPSPRRSVRLDALANADLLVMLPARYPVSQTLTRAFVDAGLAPQRIQEVDSPEAAQALAASGRGVAVLTNDTRFGLIPRRVLDADGSVLTLPLHAAWSAQHHGAHELAATAADLRDFCARLYREDRLDG